MVCGERRPDGGDLRARPSGRARCGTIPRDLIRDAAGSLRDEPGFAVPALFSLALAVGLVIPAASLVRIDSILPLRLAARIGLEPIADGEWGVAWSAALETPAEIRARELETLLAVLAGLLVLVVAIACVNLVVLLASRSARRRREVATRLMVGATRRRIARELLMEGAVLSASGGGIGVALGLAGAKLLWASWPAGLLPSAGVDPFSAVILLAAGLPVATTMAFSLAPAFVLFGSPSPVAVANAKPRSVSGRATAWPGNGLAAAQMAGLLVLLTGAGLVLRSQPGPEADRTSAPDSAGLLTLAFQLEQDSPPEREPRAAFLEKLLARVDSLPGVVAESIASPGAWIGQGMSDRVLAQCDPWCSRGGAPLPFARFRARQHAVGPGFFATLGVSVLRGREFEAADREGAPLAVVVNRTFAERFLQSSDPTGREVQLAGGISVGPWYRIVGIVEDVRPRGIGSGRDPPPAVYVSALQHPPRSAGLLVRTADDPARAAGDVVRAVETTESARVTSMARPLDRRLRAHAAPLGWFARLYAALAVAALLLAVQGLYAVMSHDVFARRREIGIRRALGARPGDVVRLVLGASLRLTAVGATVGLIGAVGLGRGLQRLLADVSLFDPVLYAGLAAILSAAALLGSGIPARRAARLDPAVALGEE